MIRRPPRSTQSRSSAASDVYKRQLVDDVVVDDEVDAARAWKLLRQRDELLAEEAARLLEVAHGVHAPGEDIEGAGNVELLVLARREDAPLVAAEHPVAADLRVLVDVDLVGVE